MKLQNKILFLIIVPLQFLLAQNSQPFLKDFDNLKIAKVPLIGKWLGPRDIFKHRLRTLAKWQKSNPLEMYQELRDFRPVANMSKIPGLKLGINSPDTIYLSKRVDIIETMEQPGIFTVLPYSRKMKALGGHMLAADETDFNNIEKPWMRSLMPHSDIAKIKIILEEIINETLKEISVKKTGLTDFNLVDDFARKVPAKFADKYFGFPGPDLKTLYRWSRTTQENYFHNLRNNKKIIKRSKNSEQEMVKYGQKLLSNPETLVEDSILKRLLLSNEVARNEITEERVLVNIIGAIIGSIETTQTAFIYALQELSRRPHFFELAKIAAKNNDDEKLAQLIWEALRFNPINPAMVRVAIKDAVVGKASGHPREIKKGTLILLGIQSAMFDESQIENPREFRIDRPYEINLNFGYGHHRCLGEMINLIQLPLMIKKMILQKNFQLLPEAKKKKSKSPFPENLRAQFLI